MSTTEVVLRCVTVDIGGGRAARVVSCDGAITIAVGWLSDHAAVRTALRDGVAIPAEYAAQLRDALGQVVG
ncbi:MAG: hypothetical protein ACRETX_17220 [Steroidobacteraceae bacterium]